MTPDKMINCGKEDYQILMRLLDAMKATLCRIRFVFELIMETHEEIKERNRRNGAVPQELLRVKKENLSIKEKIIVLWFRSRIARPSRIVIILLIPVHRWI